ncbi:hypothetical protein GYMLUDRAFT_252190 [Collybiopsis luxurians FD-317 M1]|uniref:GmrSD restriction endonucleases N-terminal domain-containing protein n=1 Tax=Collybiopsis luxurians FD-317 M1 TaxID=944289 RepID=A0A0D0BAF9_9AGAR|nr:hypothetical protein GYMLUDRAFT_252190 [Collybiopsis luxurians FD-317 M1]
MERSYSVSQDIDQLDLNSEDFAGQGSTSSGEFEMPKALKRPRDVSYSARSLYDDMKRGLIDVNPEYQRDVVWTRDKQMKLIDSVFTNHYMPPIIFAVIYDGNGTEVKKICLDGKQRLTSLKLFMDGDIPLKHPETFKNWWYKSDESSTSKNKNLLPDGIRTSFANRQIRCTEYEDLDEDDEREIFRRVQLGVALSSAEKLRVLNSPRAKFINELRDLFVTERTLGAPSFRWDRSRGADYRCFAQAVYVIYRWGNDNGVSLKNAGTLPQVEKWLDEEIGSVPEDFVNLIKETFSVVVELTAKAEYSQPFDMYPKVSPIEIIGILLLTYAHVVVAPVSQKLTLSELSAAVATMRRNVRKEHKDIRLNDRVGKTLIGFVKTYQKPIPPPTPTPEASTNILPPIATLDYPRPMEVDASLSQPLVVGTSPPKSVPSPKRRLSLPHAEERAPKRTTPADPRDPAFTSASSTSRSSTSSFPSGLGYPHRTAVPTSTPVTGPPMLSLLPFPVHHPQFMPRHGDYQYVVGPSGYIYPGTSPTQLYSLSYPSPPTHSPAHRPSVASPSSSAASTSHPAAVHPVTVKTEDPEGLPASAGVSAKRLLELQQLNRMVGEQPSVPAQAPIVPSASSPSAGPQWQSYQYMAERK